MDNIMTFLCYTFIIITHCTFHAFQFQFVRLHQRSVFERNDIINCSCSSTTGNRISGENLNFTFKPIVHFYKEYDNGIILKCHVECTLTNLISVTWLRNKEILTSNSINNVQYNGNCIFIRNSKYDYNNLTNDTYRCMVTTSNGDNFISKKGYLLKKCQRTNCPLHMNTNITNNSINQNSSQNGVYLIRGKRDDKKIFIKNITVHENDNLKLACDNYNASDDDIQIKRPRMELRWRKDDKVIRQIELDYNFTTVTNNAEVINKPTTRDDSRLFISSKNGSLFINNVLGNDAGTYTCELLSDGIVSHVISERNVLHVIENLKFAPQPNSKNLELGSLGKVHCKAHGTPPPDVKWIKDNNNPLPNNVEDVNATLVFKPVSFEHRGNYTCIASNDQGQINATITVNVVVAPRFLVAPEDTVEFLESETAVMHCQATGDPKPTVQWDKDLKYFSMNTTDQDRFQILENGTLIISNVQQKDEGTYGCTIGNSAGLKRGEVRLTLKNTDVEDISDGLISRAVLITMSFAFAYIILVITLMIWCRYRRQARKSRFSENNTANEESGNTKTKADGYEPCLTDELSVLNKKCRIRDSNNLRNDVQESNDTACTNLSNIPKTSNANEVYNLQRSSITDMVLIGNGEFGNVYIGKINTIFLKQFMESHTIELSAQRKPNIDNTTNNIINKEKSSSNTSVNDIEEIKEEHELHLKEEKLVMVKALNKVQNDLSSTEFNRQIDLFRNVKHKNVVKLFGLCRDKDPHYMILEYSNWGDLKEFLLATAGKINSSSSSSSTPPPFNTEQVLAAAYQIASGMDAIYRGRFVHKDLATRNCILSSDFIVKVSYSALCMDKYSKEYVKYGNSMLPIRWLAPECITDNDYTTKSDVYSFGLLVWELFTQAVNLPSEDLNNDEVIKCLESKKIEHHLAESTPECLKEILESCWNINPKNRPSFSQLCSAFTKAIQNLNK